MRDSHVARRDHGGPRVAATSHGLCCQARWPLQMSIMAQGAGVAGGRRSEHAGGAYFRRHHGLSASPCLGFLTLASDPDILDVLGDGPPSPAQHRGRHRMPNSGTADLQPLTTLKGGHGKLEPWVGVSSHTALAEGSDLPGHSVCDPAAITAAWGPEEMGVWLSPAHGRCSGKVRCTQLRSSTGLLPVPQTQGSGSNENPRPGFEADVTRRETGMAAMSLSPLGLQGARATPIQQRGGHSRNTDSQTQRLGEQSRRQHRDRAGDCPGQRSGHRSLGLAWPLLPQMHLRGLC